MRNEPESPPPNQSVSAPGTMAEAYRGFITFGVLNFLAFLVMSNVIGATGLQDMPLVGVGLLAVVSALAVWAYVGWRRPGFALGLVGGYALMTIISGGTCTRFVNNSLIPQLDIITGPLLYIGAVLIFGFVLLVRRLSKSGWM